VQQFNADFPGMTPPPANAATRARQLASVTLGTLVGALAVGQQRTAHFNYENGQFSALESKNQNAQGALQAIQVTDEILLAEAQQLQMMRQLLITLINADSVDRGHRLNAEAQAGAPGTLTRRSRRWAALCRRRNTGATSGGWSTTRTARLGGGR
jgi:P-type conjugative transfer protein TrbJ